MKLVYYNMWSIIGKCLIDVKNTFWLPATEKAHLEVLTWTTLLRKHLLHSCHLFWQEIVIIHRKHAFQQHNEFIFNKQIGALLSHYSLELQTAVVFTFFWDLMPQTEDFFLILSFSHIGFVILFRIWPFQSLFTSLDWYRELCSLENVLKL